ncbi:hypothetical protein ACSBOB_20035 [Mesorhizobium sp. ASY16-5R]|uniref:hypothetical protein n=1 Tax=Mesorhizobium sp. ASY16-5R TaxID=3445772 RepID=UPI003FA085ED
MYFIIDTIERRKAAAAYVARLPSSPLLGVEVKPHRRSRTVEQNRLYWMWVHVVADYTGYDEQELHLLLRERFLGYEPIEIHGKTVHTLKSTTELTVRQFTEYLNRLGRLAYYLDIVLPYPDGADFALGR